MSEATDPVQQQELEFFAMMLPGTKHHAPPDADTGAAQKYNRPNEKGGLGGGGKGRDSQERQQDKQVDKQWENWSWGQKEGGGQNGKRITALEQQVGLLTRLALRHEDAVNLARCEVSFVIHAKLGIEAGVVPQLSLVQTTWRELKKNSPEKLDKSMRSTLVLCLFREVLNRVEKLPQDPVALKEFTSNSWISQDAQFWPFLQYNSESRLLVPEKDKPGLHTDNLVRHLKAIMELCVHDHALARFHPIRPMGEKMAGDNLVFLLQTGSTTDGAKALCGHFAALCHSSAMQLCGCSLKKDRAQRSNLAMQVSKHLG